MSKAHRVSVPLFECGEIVYCDSRKQFRRVYKDCGVEPPMKAYLHSLGGAAHTLENKATGQRLFLVGVFDGEMATLAHEAAHVAFYICDAVGVEVRRGEANETFCYLVEYIVAQGLRVWRDEQGD